MTPDSITLCPAQQQAYNWLLQAAEIGNILHFACRHGSGRSTMLAQLHRELGGVLLGVQEFVEAAGARHPLALEDALYDVAMEALKKNQRVIIDDFHVATAAPTNCNYPRLEYLDSPMAVLAAYAVASGKTLIVGTNGRLCRPLAARSFDFRIDDFMPEDYRALCLSFAGQAAAELDFAKVHRFAPRLNAHHLKLACAWCQTQERLTTENFIDYLRAQRLTSNVALGEVAKVDLSELKGVDDVLQSLEANVAVPLENDELATRLRLKPKRGVLLVGPPGTGKTTVGRALAHRLRGKFFLIDGTFISGTGDFYTMVHHVFEAAKENAPSVIFIDDSDVIFESGQEHGLYRYLLTMLDGLESETVGRVCVMMTAMDVGNLPPALVRSGRIELWLEMRLPNEEARLAILQQYLASAPPPLNQADASRLVTATNGFTGADLKRTMEDAKALYAFDHVTGKNEKEITEYYVAAADTVRACKEKYEQAATRAQTTRPSRPAWFHPSLYS